MPLTLGYEYLCTSKAHLIVVCCSRICLKLLVYFQKVKPASYVNADPTKVRILVESYGASEAQAK